MELDSRLKSAEMTNVSGAEIQVSEGCGRRLSKNFGPIFVDLPSIDEENTGWMRVIRLTPLDLPFMKILITADRLLTL
ncbi:MAG: hypothetical protein ACE5KG_03505 [Nitrososphaerales archaeon]